MGEITLTTEKKKIFELTGSQLKWIALILMVVNHFTHALYNILKIDNYFTAEGHWYLTRAAFIIFAFLIAEGMNYTHDRKKYIFSLFAFALISEIPFDLANYSKIFDSSHQNVFFTLVIGALTIVGIDYFKGKAWFQVLCVLIGCVVATMLSTDYSFMGVAIIASFYAFRDVKWKQLLITGIVFAVLTLCIYLHSNTTVPYLRTFCACFSRRTMWEWYFRSAHGLLAWPLLALYHGKKGININKWFFYGFYPGHLLLIWAVLSLVASFSS